jgi:hypothetical protein
LIGETHEVLQLSARAIARPRVAILRPAMALQALRGRLPLVAVILIALLCLVLLGVACACLSDHPVQALEKALAAVAAHPALIEVWTLLPLSLLGAWALLGPSTPPRARGPSFASLQRFLL